jgi:cytochrome b subunit of formate dehydrogenase
LTWINLEAQGVNAVESVHLIQQESQLCGYNLKQSTKNMKNRNLKAWVLAGCICLFGSMLGGQSQAVAATAEASAAGTAVVATGKLDNATCESCHDANKSKLQAADANGEKRDVHAVDAGKYGGSVHSTMQCVTCHTDITDSTAPHKIAGSAKKPDCIACHEELWQTAKKNKLTKEEARLGVVVQNIEAYKKSFHAQPNKEDKTHVNATCGDCHDVHTFDVPAAGTIRRAEWRLTIPSLCGEKCHSDELEDYAASVHGKEVLEKKNMKAAVCSDCHTTHAIGNTSSDAAKLTITANCGNCHEERFASYKASYHGQVNTLGYAYTAKCFDCHGSHGILKADDPDSRVNKKNLLKTCQQCHSGKKDLPKATAGFISFSPHGTSNNFARYPEIWIATKFMAALLIGVFAFFWAHSTLWWYREYKDRKEGKSRWHIRTDALPPELPAGDRRSQAPVKYVRRFGPMWRLAHLIFAITVMLLVLTGMSVFYGQTAWAKAIMGALGGPRNAGIIHRISAFTMLGIFFIHLIAVSTNIVRNRKTFKFFGVDSFVPNWKDMYDIIGMFKWFVGKGPRPILERWTYWEKFDYWAVFWGMAIIGGSGMMLAFPHLVAKVLPGWVFNVAMVVHGEEAFLAAVFLFTVHFFNNHFRPDKLPPPDVVMFTGVQSLDEFKHEHTAQYQRLVETGQLEKYLVDGPSAPFRIGAKILGLTLIACGLTLLTLIAIGFFGGGA